MYSAPIESKDISGHFFLSKQSDHPVFPYEAHCSCGWIYMSGNIVDSFKTIDQALQYYYTYHSDMLKNKI